MGIGDWGLGPIPKPQSPIPNPQSPIPNKIKDIKFNYFLNYLLKIFIFTKNKKIIKYKWAVYVDRQVDLAVLALDLDLVVQDVVDQHHHLRDMDLMVEWECMDHLMEDMDMEDLIISN